ncbi:hypothetical protein ZWY2020_002018 [Hordeum vulgare]|nr:hypothetical protein ZWY2020_002018 [Hordeum vulgare]
MEPATSQEADCWSSLPADLLVLILNRLRWSSHPSFSMVCKRWRSAVSPFYPLWITPLLLSSSKVGTTNARYYSPYYHKSFEIADNTLPGAMIGCATGQHLTLRMDNLRILDLQLMSGAAQELPPIDEAFRATYDFVVYDGDRTMYAVDPKFDRVQIVRSIKNNTAGWGDWANKEFDLDKPWIMASPDCNPVLHDGAMYILGEDGRLGVYKEDGHAQSFRVLDKPLSFGSDEHEEKYLVHNDRGKLMAVLFGRRGTPVDVVELDKRTMEWKKVESLEGRALFTGTRTTLMKKTKLKWMQNKIFVPRLHDWPETVHVDVVQRDGELAFLPKQGSTGIKTGNCGTGIWSHEMGQIQEARGYWGTERVDYSIWVDLDGTAV